MRLIEANWIRTYSILSIVLWHCLVCPISYWNLLETSDFTQAIKSIFYFFIPQANMPLFTCLSGYLFSHLYNLKKESYTTFKGVFVNKFKRLVIPFLTIGTIATAVVPERPLISGIIWGDGSSLWFCIMLFWLTMLRWVVLKINHSWLKVVVFLFSVIIYLLGIGLCHSLRIIPIPIGLLCIGRALHFYCFFVLGSLLYRKRAFLANKMCCTQKGIVLMIYLLIGVFSLLEIGVLSFICQKLMPVMLILVVFIASYEISKRTAGSIKLGEVISNFCRHSFGIYVFHEAFSWNCYHTPVLQSLFRAHPLCYSVLFTIITLFLCYIATYYCLKTKLGQALLK